MKWIVNFIYLDEEKDEDIPMITFIEGDVISEALDDAGDNIELWYGEGSSVRFVIHSIALAADQDMPRGLVMADPVGLEPEDIKMLAWWRKE